jgi:hypothetical protein
MGARAHPLILFDAAFHRRLDDSQWGAGWLRLEGPGTPPLLESWHEPPHPARLKRAPMRSTLSPKGERGIVNDYEEQGTR